MPARTPEDVITKLETLPVAKRLDFLDAISAGDLDTAAKAGGGVSRAQLAALQPSGDTGMLLDGLEKQAFFQHKRRLDIAVLKALPAAVATLAALAESAAPGEAPSGDDKPAMALFLAQTNMFPKVCEQRRIAALALFDVAKELGLFTLAKEYRAADIEAAEEAELLRLAKEQGIDLPSLGALERTLRSVK